jgi:tripartite ATP-independent transporter DctM subunit
MSELLLLAFFGILMLLYVIGIPVGYALGLTVIIIMLLPIGPPLNFQIVTRRIYSGMTSWVLLAIPFFLFVGRIMNETGITEDLFEFATELIGPTSGGLAQVNVVVSLIFSGMSGSAVADAAGLGTVEYEAMTAHGYDGKSAVGVTGASAVIGPIIPPSIPIVIYAVLAQESIGTLFIAGVVPGLLLGLSLMITIYYLARKHDWPDGGSFDFTRIGKTFAKSLPGLLTPAIIIGGIISGLFTATEAALVATVYALFLGVFYYRSISLEQFYEVSKDTFVDTASIVIIIGFANLYAFWLTLAGVPDVIGEFVLGFSSDPLITLVMLTVVFLIMGTFMEVMAIILIMVPLLVPLFPQLGLDPIHFGIVLVLTLMYGLVTPPFGVILFVLERVTDESLEDVMRAMFPYYLPLAIVLLATILFPELTLGLPEYFGL